MDCATDSEHDFLADWWFGRNDGHGRISFSRPGDLFMSDLKLRSAIPIRRYQLGEFKVVLLGDIESSDGISYQFILAFIPEGEAQPLLYITCERNPTDEQKEGSHRIRVIAPHDARIFGSSDRWRDVEAFAEDGLLMGRKLLDLTDEELKRLM